MTVRNVLFALLILPALWSCGQRVPTIDFGKAECAHCRMNVVDARFGAALITVKGRQYAFDDIVCMVHFVDKGTVAQDQVEGWWVCDHAQPGVLIDATTAAYVLGPSFRSPMRGDAAAFIEAPAEAQGERMDWETLRAYLRQ